MSLSLLALRTALEQMYMSARRIYAYQISGYPDMIYLEPAFRENVLAAFEELVQADFPGLWEPYVALVANQRRLLELDSQLAAIASNFLEIPRPQNEQETQIWGKAIKNHILTSGHAEYWYDVDYRQRLDEAHEVYMVLESLIPELMKE